MKVSREDPIETLRLSNRPLNALRRAGVRTVGEVIELIASSDLASIRQIGAKSQAEIEHRIASVTLKDQPRTAQMRFAVGTGFSTSLGQPSCAADAVLSGGPTDWEAQQHSLRQRVLDAEALVKQAVQLQAQLARRQLKAGLLHPRARIGGDSVAHWLSVIDSVEPQRALQASAAIVGSPASICDELESVFRGGCRKPGHLAVLLSRYGLERTTLEQIGRDIGITRERVRQICARATDRIESCVASMVSLRSFAGTEDQASLLRMQSALLIAEDMGSTITYEEWKHRISSSGLVGTWASADYLEIDPVEGMIAVCAILAGRDLPVLQIPENLRCAIQLAREGQAALPAHVIHSRAILSKPVRRLIRRHTNYTGCVLASWLAEESRVRTEEMAEALQSLGYVAVGREWYMPGALDGSSHTNINSVLHRALRKLFKYCGPLCIDDVCAGVRSAVSREKFTVPPPDVMGTLLLRCGYSREQGMYYWDGESTERLTRGEAIITSCLTEFGPVVHHTELIQALLDSELAIASLHPTLQQSPLFERIGAGLYKMRGREVDHQDIERAQMAGEQTPMHVEVGYRRSGQLIVAFTLGAMALGTGVIISEHFPNLTGEWTLYVSEQASGKLQAKTNELRGLRTSLELLGCRPGDRLRLLFDPRSRGVTVDKVGTDYANQQSDKS